MRRIALVAAGTAFAGLAAALWWGVQTGRFRRESAVTTGRVVRSGERSQYKFQRDGEIFTGVVDAPLAEGTEVTVFYDPASPSLHHASADGHPPDALLDPGSRIPAVAAVFALAVAVGFWIAGIRWKGLAGLVIFLGACSRKPPPPPVPGEILDMPAGPIEVREGEKVVLTVRQKQGGWRDLWIEFRDGSKMAMTRKSPSEFEARFVPEGDTAVRVLGPPEHPWIEIKVRKFVRIARVRAQVRYPEYLKWPEAEKAAADLAAGVPLGSVVKLEPELTGAARWTLLVDDREAAECVVSREKHELRVRLENALSESFSVRGLPDLPPVVKPVSPFRDLLITPEARIPVEAAAEDDFGIVEVRVRVTRGTQVLVDAAVQGRETIAIPGLQPREKLVLQFVVRDAKQETRSREFRLLVENREEAISYHGAARRVLRQSVEREAARPSEGMVLQLGIDLAVQRDEAEMNGILDADVRAKLDRAAQALREALAAVRKGDLEAASRHLGAAAEALN